MAYESITVTPGVSGVSVAFDVVSGLYLPIGKMDVGGDGASIPVIGDADIGGVPTEQRARHKKLTANAITTSAGAYSAGDVIGGLLTFPNAARYSGGAGVIRQAVAAFDTAALTPTLGLVLLSATPAAPVADNGAFDIPDAEHNGLVRRLPLTAFAPQPAAGSVWDAGADPIPFVASGTSLFAYLVIITGTPTLGSTSDVDVYLWVEQS